VSFAAQDAFIYDISRSNVLIVTQLGTSYRVCTDPGQVWKSLEKSWKV